MRTVFYLIAHIEKNKFFRKQTIIAFLLYSFVLYSTNNVPSLEMSRSATDIYIFIVVTGVTAVYLLLSIAFTRNTFVGIASDSKYYRATPLSDLNIIIYCGYERIRPILVSIVVALIALWNIIHKMLGVSHFSILVLYLGIILCACIVILIATTISTVSAIMLKIIYRFLALLPVAFILFCVVNEVTVMDAIPSFADTSFLNSIYSIPILGWIIGIVILSIYRQYVSVLFYVLLLTILATGLWQLIKSKRNHIVEQAFADRTSRHILKTNQLPSQAFVLPSWCAIYERKRLVQRRCGKKSVFSMGTWVSIIGTVILGIGIAQSQNEVGDTIPAEYALLISALMGSVFTLCLFANEVEWSELDNPFFRLIPIGVVGKFININFSLYIRCFVVGIAALGIIGLYTGCLLFDIIMAFISFMSINFIFSCGQIVSYKLFGIVDDIMVSENIKMVMNLLLIVPSVVTYIVMLLLEYNTAICTAVFVCMNAVIGVVSIFFSKGVLS